MWLLVSPAVFPGLPWQRLSSLTMSCRGRKLCRTHLCTVHKCMLASNDSFWGHAQKNDILLTRLLW